jgi:hypothetical protein
MRGRAAGVCSPPHSAAADTKRRARYSTLPIRFTASVISAASASQ